MKVFLSILFLLYAFSCFAGDRVFDYPSQCIVKRKLGYGYTPQERTAIMQSYSANKKNPTCFAEFSQKYIKERIRRCKESGGRPNIGGGCLHVAGVMGGCEMNVAIEYCQ